MSNNNMTEKFLNFTAYPQTEKTCKDELSQSTLDIDSFQQHRQHCSLSSCHGMCCYNGVNVNQETAEVIQRVVEEEADFFKAIGLDLPAEVIIDDKEYEKFTVENKEWEGICSIKKTAVKEKPFSNLVKDYPQHFKNTVCVFTVDDGRCGLQLLAEAKGLHRWYYKPFTCWIFPILIAPGENQPEILLPSSETEPWHLPDFDGYFTKAFCGKPADCGQLGYILLQEELKFLGEIVGRNFAQEIQDSVTISAKND
ncbi:hypothetical protein H6G54_11510 [Anabaena cylindrica FACHB-243]|uniref:DUF3109 family protein n=2 Tax=Anabaena cylindrica TaxID=1165 RepID=K9ZMT7_ANACC|nr:hypothetical protein [Anabaena sp. CCAP 1446/1C]AFZ60553.1 hypothetical protein Anacy_5223 [Anabaena cylindrica PCC 7122]MBD2418314.1 hypothetical protein [Anabaena cylindrica FACHB-243]MBY5284270.1 DUF3109 family protein [Anabaena sp. CCAP 1446/1C]MBY5307911.1 DUF3109 family protein [Anabaena sp. CCAP 1446/1C]MCM2408835.1 hypothetical protein [Anabaena sp. CCAP 1446/1C]